MTKPPKYEPPRLQTYGDISSLIPSSDISQVIAITPKVVEAVKVAGFTFTDEQRAEYLRGTWDDKLGAEFSDSPPIQNAPLRLPYEPLDIVFIFARTTVIAKTNENNKEWVFHLRYTIAQREGDFVFLAESREYEPPHNPLLVYQTVGHLWIERHGDSTNGKLRMKRFPSLWQ